GGCHDGDALLLAIEHEADVVLVGDLGGFLDVQPEHHLAAGTGLVRDEALAQQLVRRRPDLVIVGADTDAARLAAGARVDLRLHHPAIAADLVRAVYRLLGTVGQAAARDGDAEVGKDLLGLILMYVHTDGLLYEDGAAEGRRGSHRSPRQRSTRPAVDTPLQTTTQVRRGPLRSARLAIQTYPRRARRAGT